MFAISSATLLMCSESDARLQVRVNKIDAKFIDKTTCLSGVE